MSAADRARWRRARRLARRCVLAGAFGAARSGALHSGLPYIYNVDENAHFVPRAIGMFGHSLQPGLLHQPARVHLRAARRCSGCAGAGDGVARAFAADPASVVRARARRRRGARDGRGRPARVGRRAAVRPPGRLLAAALLAVAFLPVYYATSRSTTRRRSRRCAWRWSGRRHAARRAARATTRSPGSASASPARRSTRRGSWCCRCSRPPRSPRARRRALARPRCSPGSSRWSRSWSPTRTRCWTSHAFRDGLHEQSAASSDGGGKLGLADENGLAYYLRDADLGARLAAARGRARRRRLAGAARSPAALVLVPAPLVLPRSSWGRRTASSPAGCCRSTRC